MSMTLDDVTADALKLAPAERAELIERLADSVLPAATLHPAWEAEIARRVAEMDAGMGKSIPAEQVLGELQTLLAQVSPGQP